MSPERERRHHRRLGAQLAADVLRCGGSEALGWVTDISRTGARLFCHGPLEEGEGVTLLLHAEKDESHCRVVFARVVRVLSRLTGRDLWTHAAAVEFNWPFDADASGLGVRKA